MHRLAVTVALLSLSATAAERPAWLWPVPLDPAVSSNFCEYRDGRFHAGIDVRTFGREGVPCLAVADGWVSRLRAASRGYGKALYVTLADSTTVVYGHLSEFTPALEDTLLAAQMRDTTYAVDLAMPRGRFRVSAGDTIAYSGSTGTLAPHVHFEVRDARERPIDPFGTDLAMPDSVRPWVSRVVFVPLSAASRVDGRPLPWGATPRRIDDGRYVVDDTLYLRGPVGVAASVSDRVNALSGSLAPHALEVHADDDMRGRIVLNRFAFDQSGEVDHFYHAGVLRARGVTLIQLWDTGSSPFDVTWVQGGTLPQDSSRVHHGRVIARDSAGNATSVEFVFVCGTFAPREHENLRMRRDLTVELSGAFFQDGFAAIPRQPLAGGDFRAGGAEPIVLEARHLGRGVQPLATFADDDTAALWVAGLVAGEDRMLRLPAHGMSVFVPGKAVRTDAVVYVRGRTDAGKKIEGLKRLSRPVRIGPIGWVLHGALTVHVDLKHPQEHQAIYRYDDYRRSWAYLSSTPDSSGWSASSDRPGVFAVFRDDHEPRVGKPVLARTLSWADSTGRREIHVAVTDDGSGFDESRTRIFVGGVKQLFRWDFVGKKLVVPLHDASIIGRQSVRVIAYDRSGNRSTRDATINTGEP
ncbi:MAG TPA: M23 family metallopeptidase [Candidatus Krumholzibacteria bacterium]